MQPGEAGRKRVFLKSFHDCATMCGRSEADPRGDLRQRAACRCLLPDFDPARWDGVELDLDASAIAHDVGLALARRNEDTGHDLDTQGCPWSFVQSRWAQSLMRYLGHRNWEGQRQRSLLLERRMLAQGEDEDDPLLIWDAVSWYEAHEDGAWDEARRRSE